MPKVARMDDVNRALCFALRNPPKGEKKRSYTDIRKLVRKKDTRRPSISAIAEAAATYTDAKEQVGRPEGWRKTTKADDKLILKAFHRVRPPGHGVTSRKVHKALPKKLRKKICKRTVISRLAEKGIKPQQKLRKNDFSEALLRKRLNFAKKHLDWDANKWVEELQAVGDIKEFTWYPEDLRARFFELRAPWTYMTDAERRLAAFQRPKQWFPKKDWQRVKKQKVFGITLSNGKSLAFLVPKPWSTEIWAKQVKEKVVPFMQKHFPRRQSITILLDGEQLLHGPEAKAAMLAGGIKVFPGWPGYSPDLNPQENVWSQSEEVVREEEEAEGFESFEDFCRRLLTVVKRYPFGKKLVRGMPWRMNEVVERKGYNIGK